MKKKITIEDRKFAMDRLKPEERKLIEEYEKEVLGFTNLNGKRGEEGVEF